ncbi:hypothetical protein RD1_A0076 (plasmid) [Roseobacter denitrificans OCh 114]|uniref:Uncharacterized protein n=1 Tax=Roseobacter denitrificans (strain ATCC 33942 / OCh 114) TaxID=375451 RepID=Q07GM4_ROSDO|nr:hypothetical protein RD1_A0076 [Roseobacter denitrificans OCh 114]
MVDPDPIVVHQNLDAVVVDHDPRPSQNVIAPDDHLVGMQLDLHVRRILMPLEDNERLLIFGLAEQARDRVFRSPQVGFIPALFLLVLVERDHQFGGLPHGADRAGNGHDGSLLERDCCAIVARHLAAILPEIGCGLKKAQAVRVAGGYARGLADQWPNCPARARCWRPGRAGR